LPADFYNWNRVKIRYCDGSSFTGDVETVDTVCFELILYDQFFRNKKIRLIPCFQFRRKISITEGSEFGMPSSMIYLL
jgi:hypothetical protein